MVKYSTREYFVKERQSGTRTYYFVMKTFAIRDTVHVKRPFLMESGLLGKMCRYVKEIGDYKSNAVLDANDSTPHSGVFTAPRTGFA